MAELKPRKVKPKKSNVFSKILSWFLILAFISLSGYLGYIVIQLKTDKRVAEQETQVQVLEGQVQILQVTIEKLKLEGENLQKNPDLSKYEQSSFKKDIISTKSVAKVTAYACPTKKNVHTWTDKEIEMNCPSWNGVHGTTAVGVIPKTEYTIACDSNWIGKIIHIEGVGKRVCQDTGGKIDNNGQIKIDEFVQTKEEANQKGIRYLTINPV